MIIKWLVINNNGGRIFNRLAINASPMVEDYFVMPQSVSLKKIAEFADVSYQLVTQKVQWLDTEKKLNSPHSELVEIQICDNITGYEKSNKKW